VSAGRVSIVGGESIDLGQSREGRIKVGELKPRERRWLKLSVRPRSEKPVMVDFFDTAPARTEAGGPSNGFTIQFARAPIEVVAKRDMLAFADVCTRLSILQKSAAAGQEAKDAMTMIRRERITASSYEAYLKKHSAAIQSILASHLRTANNSDPFEIASALKELTAAKDVEALAAAHNAFNERLDAHLTMLVRLSPR
jgi:hypothetical protein